jgi:hypothetical protein
VLALQTLVHQLRVLREERDRQELLGPELGFECAVEDVLDGLTRMGKVFYQQVAVYA